MREGATASSARGAVRVAVMEHNADLRREGWIAIGVGIATLALMYVVILLLTATFRFMFFLSIGMIANVLIAAVIFAAFAVVGWRSATRGVEVHPPDDSDEADVALRALTLGATDAAFNPAYLASGPAYLLVYGPRSILSGQAQLDTALPEGERALAAAEALLMRLLKGSMPLAAIEPKAAALVLLRIGFAKFEKAGSTTVVSTIKGREAVMGTQG